MMVVPSLEQIKSQLISPEPFLCTITDGKMEADFLETLLLFIVR